MPDFNYQRTNSYGNRTQGYNGGQSRYDNATGPTAEALFKEQQYQSRWITDGADPSTVKYAEEMGRFMAKKGLTNSKIRSIYGEIKRIQMGVFEKEKSSFYLLKPKVAYALGRDEKNEGLKLFKLVFDRASADVCDQDTYKHFCEFIEAILAFHKANGGKD